MVMVVPMTMIKNKRGETKKRGKLVTFLHSITCTMPTQLRRDPLVFSGVRFPSQEAVTYTQTMSDEARRLAYVALTRARLGVMWVPLSVGEAQPGANNNGQSSTSVASQGSFVLV